MFRLSSKSSYLLSLFCVLILTVVGSTSVFGVPKVSYVYMTPASVPGGSTSQGKVTLRNRAPAGGVVVAIASSNPSVAQVPQSVTVPADEYSVTFTATTSAVSSTTTVIISAIYNGATRTTTFEVTRSTSTAVSLSSLALSPPSVTGGATSQGTVTLSGAAPSGGAVVALSSNNAAKASVPASVTVASGTTTKSFTVTTSAVSSNTTVTLSASYSGVTRTASLLITPPAPAPPSVSLSSLALSPTSVTGGASSQGTVTLSGAAPSGGVVVALSSNNAAKAAVPASVTLASGTTTRTFTITTSAVSSNTTVTLSASYSGVTRTASLLLTAPPPPSPPPPAVTLSSITLNPTSIVGGGSSQGTVTLSGSAPSGGVLVNLSSSNTARATVPSSVTVASGATSANFTVSTTIVSSIISVTLTASYNGVIRTAAIQLTAPPPPPPVSVSSVMLNPSSLTGGSSSQGGVFLTGAAPSGGAVVTLSCSNTSVATVPASVTVSAGASTANFGVTTNPVSTDTTVTISASFGSGSASSGLVVNSPGGPPQSGGTTYYVSPSGSDSNLGTAQQPFRTIQKAAGLVDPGDTVIVENGVYTKTGSSCGGVVCISRGGTSSNWVVFRSRNKWGAKLDGQNSSTAEGFSFTNGAGFVRIEGFEIYGMGNISASASGIDMYAGGHDSQIVGNRIHHIGNNCASHGNGQPGIFVQVANVVIEGNLIHDIGRHFPGESGCSYPGGFSGYQQLDHGVYVNGSSGPQGRATNVMIRNNIFYNTRHGWAVQFYPGTLRNINVINNTFAFGNPNKSYTFLVLDAGLTDVNIINNIFYQPEGGRTMELGSGLSASSVVISGNIASGSAMSDRSPVSGMLLSNNRTSTNPMLVNPAGFDFHLQSGSPAINTGVLRLDVEVDFDGRDRPQGSGYDIGAYEFSSGVAFMPLRLRELDKLILAGIPDTRAFKVSQTPPMSRPISRLTPRILKSSSASAWSSTLFGNRFQQQAVSDSR